MFNIRYLRGKDSGVELVVCEASCLSYPLHNHVSVFTIGMILSGSIQLRIGNAAYIYNQSGAFIIPPYVPHGIEAQGSYTLLSVCIDKGGWPGSQNLIIWKRLFSQPSNPPCVLAILLNRNPWP